MHEFKVFFYPQVECTAEKGVLRQLHFQGLPHVSFDEFRVFLSAAVPKVNGIAKSWEVRGNYKR